MAPGNLYKRPLHNCQSGLRGSDLSLLDRVCNREASNMVSVGQNIGFKQPYLGRRFVVTVEDE
jgi:hypothetical protein